MSLCLPGLFYINNLLFPELLATTFKVQPADTICHRVSSALFFLCFCCCNPHVLALGITIRENGPRLSVALWAEGICTMHRTWMIDGWYNVIRFLWSVIHDSQCGMTFTQRVCSIINFRRSVFDGWFRCDGMKCAFGITVRGSRCYVRQYGNICNAPRISNKLQ